MALQNLASGIVSGMSSTPRLPPKGVLTDLEWSEIFDALTLALDAMGDGPDDTNLTRFMNAVFYQRHGLKIAHRRLELIEKARA